MEVTIRIIHHHPVIMEVEVVIVRMVVDIRMDTEEDIIPGMDIMDTVNMEHIMDTASIMVEDIAVNAVPVDRETVIIDHITNTIKMDGTEMNKERERGSSLGLASKCKFTFSLSLSHTLYSMMETPHYISIH